MLCFSCLMIMSCLPQDCSIDVLPISDPACFDPLATSYKYSEVAVQAYYVTLDTIRSALPDVGTRCCGCSPR